MNLGVFSRDAVNARRRAVVKTLCYRALMVTITVVVAWLVVGDVGQAASIGLVTNAVKTLTYYGYERLWDHVSWGVGVSG
ncbi:hypothetical protein DM2_1545 [Halorubrum sp. DM2]|uniref:DUF2061 domain-containing protein n=1 Tax=unclassified Halorubrum TaxID=2642239 RepID=UPI0003DCCBD6|nr:MULTISPECIES: DUF2061 domain-containing protein [unclassified Halorubrum]CDK40881.1 uncharacterized protein BN903_10 [Halorubrum sp. AJ67]VTT88211.1 hypothetical protein DM2_1545 [Halorubrum sp. DM2]